MPANPRAAPLQLARCFQLHREAGSAYPPAAFSASLKMRSTSQVWICLVSFPNDPLGCQGHHRERTFPHLQTLSSKLLVLEKELLQLSL